MQEIPPRDRDGTRKDKNIRSRKRFSLDWKEVMPIFVVRLHLLKEGTHYYHHDELIVECVSYDDDEEQEISSVMSIKLDSTFTGYKRFGFESHIYELRRVTDMFGIPVTPKVWEIRKQRKKIK